MPIYGNATFKGNSVNNGEVDSAVFTDTSVNNGEVHSNAAFLGNANNSGIVAGDASFSEESVNDGMVDGDTSYSDDALDLEEIISEEVNSSLPYTQKVEIEELAPPLGGVNDNDNIFPGGVSDSYAIPEDSFNSYSNIVPFKPIPSSFNTYIKSLNLHHIATDTLLNSKTYDIEEVRIHSDIFFRSSRENFGSYFRGGDTPIFYEGEGYKPFLIDHTLDGVSVPYNTVPEEGKEVLLNVNTDRAIRIKLNKTKQPTRKDFTNIPAEPKNQQVLVEGVSTGDWQTLGAVRAVSVGTTVHYYNKAGKLIETLSRQNGVGDKGWRNNNGGNIMFVESWMGKKGVIGKVFTGYDKKGKPRYDCIFSSVAHGDAAIDFLLTTDDRYINAPNAAEMIKIYAPSNDAKNDPVKYAKVIQKHITTGENIYTMKYKDLSKETRGQVIAAIKVQEGARQGKTVKGSGALDKVRIDIDPSRTRLDWIDAMRIDSGSLVESPVPIPCPPPPQNKFSKKLTLSPAPQDAILNKQSIDTFFNTFNVSLSSTIIRDGIGISEFNIASGELESSMVPINGDYVFSISPMFESWTADLTSSSEHASWKPPNIKYWNHSVEIHNPALYNTIRRAYYTGTSLSALNSQDEDLKSVYVASFKEIHNMIASPRGPTCLRQPPTYYYGEDLTKPATSSSKFSNVEMYTDVNTCCFSLYGIADLKILKRYMPSIEDYVIQPDHPLGVTALGGEVYTTYTEDWIINDFSDTEEIATLSQGSVEKTNGYYQFEPSNSNFAISVGLVPTGNADELVPSLVSLSAGEALILATNSLLNNPSTVVGGADYVEAAAAAYSKVRPHTWHRVCNSGSLVAVADTTRSFTYSNYFGGTVYLFGLNYNGTSNTAHSVYGSLKIPSANRNYNIKDKKLLGAALDAHAVKMFWGTTDPAVLVSLNPCILIYCANTGVKITVPVVDIRNDRGIGLTYGTLKKMFPTFNKNATNYPDSVQAIVAGMDEDTLLIRPSHIGINLTHEDVLDHIRAQSYGINYPLIAQGATAARRTFQQIRRAITSGVDSRLVDYVSREAREAYKNKKLPSNMSKVVTAVAYTATPAARVAKIVQGALAVVRYSPEIRINAAKFFTDLRNKDAKFGLKKIWIGFKNKAIDYVADMDEIHIVESIYNAAVKIVYKKHENWSLQATVEAIRKRGADAEEGSTITGVIGSSH